MQVNNVSQNAIVKTRSIGRRVENYKKITHNTAGKNRERKDGRKVDKIPESSKRKYIQSITKREWGNIFEEKEEEKKETQGNERH